VGRLKTTPPSLLLVLAVVGVLGLAGCGPTAEKSPTSRPLAPSSTPAGTAVGQSSSVPSTSNASPPEGSPPAVATPVASGAGATPGSAPSGAPTAPGTPVAGSIWQSLTDFPSAGAFEVTSVTATTTGFTAVGFAGMPGEDYFGRHQGVVWRSTDGRTWEGAPDPALQYVTPEDVVALGDTLFLFGTFEMCGLNLDEECEEPVDAGWAVWRSVSNGVWERLPQLAEMQTGTVDGATTANGSLVCFGWTGDESLPTIWTSPDGASWNQTSDLAEMEQVTAVAGTPAGMVAFGTGYSAELDDLELVVAASSDGSHFGRTDAPPLSGTAIQSVAAGGTGVVAIGDTEDADFNVTGVALHSSDGLAWGQSAASDGSFNGAAGRAALSVPTGYVGIGIVPDPNDSGVLSGASWFSVDGLSWRTMAPFGSGFSDLDTSAAGPAGIVAFTVTEIDTDISVTSTISAFFAPVEALPSQ
jgi:hypothetical protein